MIPIAGSAYTYTYATLGELIAWIIGWDLILEYAFANMSVSRRLRRAHRRPARLAQHPSRPQVALARLSSARACRTSPATTSSRPAGIAASTSPPSSSSSSSPSFSCSASASPPAPTTSWCWSRSPPSSSSSSSALTFIHPGNYHPFSPNGFSGILAGGSIIFFTYIGFDAVSTASEECRNPQRDVPIGIIATLVVCTILYIGVALVLTGMVPWQSVAGDGAPIVNALKRVSL